VQIAAALGAQAQIIIMDEPTSSLSVHESENLFRLLAKLKQRGITIIYVSHRMEEIFRLCDHVTVLRDGRLVATSRAADTDSDRIIHQMVGRELKQYTSQHLQRRSAMNCCAWKTFRRRENSATSVSACAPGRFSVSPG